jgi:hypothetical protein
LPASNGREDCEIVYGQNLREVFEKALALEYTPITPLTPTNTPL